jgi:uncharacterized membrane protein
MIESPIPNFVFALCFVAGILLIALAIPLWLRRIPPNVFYGVRFRSALADEDVWYELNARGGRNLFFIGVGYVVLLGLTLAFGRAWGVPAQLLVPTILLVIALILNTLMLRNAARHLATTMKQDQSG